MNDDIKQLRLRYRGTCALCGVGLEAGTLKTARMLRRPGPYDDQTRRMIWEGLARRLPPA